MPDGSVTWVSSADAVPASEDQYHRRVYLHQIGTPADEDVMIFGEGMDKTTYYSVGVSLDGRWLSISASPGTAPRNDLWLADLFASAPDAPDLKVVQQGVDAQTGVYVAERLARRAIGGHEAFFAARAARIERIAMGRRGGAVSVVGAERAASDGEIAEVLPEAVGVRSA